MATNFEVKYRKKEQDMIPSATHVNGEPVWAEIARRDEDLAIVYVTKPDAKASDDWHIYIAYASDDPVATEFQEVFAWGGHDATADGPASYPMYVKALEAAADIAGD